MLDPVILYFGSFNPIHQGHLSVARAAQQYYGGKAEVWFVLSAQNPFKQKADLWPDEKRWKLLLEAIANKPGMKACDVELNLPTPSYTIKTLNYLRQQNESREFVVLIGEDNLAGYTQWKDYKSILQMCKIMVYPRKEENRAENENSKEDQNIYDKNKAKIPSDLAAYTDRIILLEGDLLAQSSTAVREVNIGSDPKDWAQILQWRGSRAEALRQESQKIKEKNVGKNVYLRGLIEYSNYCAKNCYYCGIRRDNSDVKRYIVSEEEVLNAMAFAHKEGFGSVVLQGGEIKDKDFVLKIEKLLKQAMTMSGGQLGITLSFGEQDKDTLKRWREAGARRYLLRVETSNEALYKRLHPSDHSFKDRIKTLDYLKETDYQVGSGVMIGLPWQSPLDMANDLYFFKQREIDMVGMGPYIEHRFTPLYEQRKNIPSLEERYEYSLNMLALLRLLMPTINIASTTAMASLNPKGREEALRIAANVIMPNITPYKYRENYFLYENKLCICESEQDSKEHIEETIRNAQCEVAYFKSGDSKHYFNRLDPKNEDPIL